MRSGSLLHYKLNFPNLNVPKERVVFVCDTFSIPPARQLSVNCTGGHVGCVGNGLLALRKVDLDYRLEFRVWFGICLFA